MGTIRRHVIEELVPWPPEARRRVISKPTDKDETLAQEARELLGGRRRAFSGSTQGGAPGAPRPPAQHSATGSGGWPFTAEQQKQWCDRVTGNDRWNSFDERSAAMSMLEAAGMPRHKVYAMAANGRMSRARAQDIIDRMPSRRR